MSYIGTVQVEDGRLRTGAGMVVRSDGSVDVNVVSPDPLPVSVVSSSEVAGTCSAFSAGATSSQLLAAGAIRGGVILNNSASTIYINFGTGAADATNGFPIPPGGQFVLPTALVLTQAVQVLGVSGGADVRVATFQ